MTHCFKDPDSDANSIVVSFGGTSVGLDSWASKWLTPKRPCDILSPILKSHSCTGLFMRSNTQRGLETDDLNWIGETFNGQLCRKLRV